MVKPEFFKKPKKPAPRQLHVLLSEEDHAKLVALSRATETGASDVIRQLIRAAKVKEA
jgi:hypothetical protein